MEYTAALIIIGNEILAGVTQDKNLLFLAQQLEQRGIQLQECRIIADDEDAIIESVNKCRERYSYVFTTGGIGPTHDDITTATIARCFGKRLLRNRKAIAMMLAHYQASQLDEAQLKMADIPAGALLLDNPVSGAPGFQLDNVFVLPGVPVIIQAMMPKIISGLAAGSPIASINIITDLFEASLAKPLAAIQAQYADVSIGSYPFFRKQRPGVKLVLRATDGRDLAQARAKIEKMIDTLGGHYSVE